MKSDWLAASSLERTHEILSAINTLSIHAKLTLADVIDPTSETDLQAARERVGGFLERLQALVQGSQPSQGGAVVGADPQLGELAIRYLSADKRTSGHAASALSIVPISTATNMVRSERTDDMDALVEYLRDLRALLEEYSYSDIATFEESQ